MKKITNLVFGFTLISLNTYAQFQNVNLRDGLTKKGQIVFSQSTIDETTGKTLSTATFDVSDKIYCRMYLPKKLSSYKDVMNESSSFFRVWCKFEKFPENEYTVYEYNCKTKEEAKNESFEFIFNFNPDDTLAKAPDLLAKLNDLPPGNYKMIVWSLQRPDAKPMAEGEFTYVKTVNSATVKIGKTFDNEVKAKMTDAALEANAIKVLTDGDIEKYDPNRFNGGKFKYKIDVLKIKIISQDWKINKNNKTGVIIGRLLDFAVLAKKDDGSCVIYVYTMEQQFNGTGYQDSFGGYVGPAYPNSTSWHPLHRKLVDCE